MTSAQPVYVIRLNVQTRRRSHFTRDSNINIWSWCVHVRACARAFVHAVVFVFVFVCVNVNVNEHTTISTESCDWKEIIGIYFFRLRFPFHLHHSLFKFAIVHSMNAHTRTSITLNTRVISEFSENSYFVAFGRMRRRHPIQTKWRTPPIYLLSHQFRLCIDCRYEGVDISKHARKSSHPLG